MTRKLIVRALVITLAIIATQGVFAQQATHKVGVFDFQRVFENSKFGKQLKSELDAFQKSKQNEIDQREAKLKGMESTLETQKGILTAEKWEQMLTDYNEERNSYVSFAKSAQESMERKKQTALAKFGQRLESVLNAFGKEKGYTLLMERTTVAYASNGIDCTDELIRRLDQASS